MGVSVPLDTCMHVRLYLVLPLESSPANRAETYFVNDRLPVALDWALA